MTPGGNWISAEEFERLLREEANRISDERIEHMADRDGERLARLEEALKFVREGQEQAASTAHEERQAMRDEIAGLRGEVQKLKDVLTKASGVKLAFMLFVGGLGFLLSQMWHLLSFTK